MDSVKFLLVNDSKYLVEIDLNNEIVLSNDVLEGLLLEKDQVLQFKAVLSNNYEETFKIVRYE